MLMHQLLRDGAERAPDKIALRWVDRDRALTFAAAVAEMEKFAGALHHLGVRKGDRVTVFAQQRAAAGVATLRHLVSARWDCRCRTRRCGSSTWMVQPRCSGGSRLPTNWYELDKAVGPNDGVVRLLAHRRHRGARQRASRHHRPRYAAARQCIGSRASWARGMRHAPFGRPVVPDV